MRRYLLAAVWPAGMAAITAATVIALRRSSASSRPAAPADVTAPAGTDPAADARESRPDRTPRPEPTENGHRVAGATQSRVALPARVIPLVAQTGLSLSSPATLPEWLPGVIEVGAISAAGGLLSYQLMALLGRPVVKYGPKIDVPVMEWTSTHQVPWWAAVVQRLNKIGNTWTTWGASGTAAACLAVTWPRRKWLPPAVLGAAILVDHYVTLALRYKFRRLGPPSSPLGTYPAGGCDRVILFYGLVANLLWREFSGSHRGKVLARGAMSALAFNQAYCRGYLSKHWTTDILSGLLYGIVLYAPFAAAIRLVAGPPAVRTGPPGGPAPVPA